jgi:WD40 repeat protein
MSLESTIARIRREDTAIVGTGFLVSEQYLLTCAHVVADALGLDHYATEMPEESLYLDFPYLQIAGVRAKVIDWKPRSEIADQTGDDMALLQLETPVSHPKISLIGTATIKGHNYHAVGFPQGYNNSASSYGIVRDCLPSGRWQIEGDEGGIPIQGGFSGCPVWDERAKGIIGMVVEEADKKVAFMIPTEVLAQAFPELQEWVIPYPFMAEELPEDFVPRPGEFESLIAHLLDGNQPMAITAALKGAGGYGKTVLARAICHDRRIRERFRDGIFWVTLGENPDLLVALTKLYQALTDSTHTFVDKEQAAKGLAQEWQGKRCLAVIDDVWNQAHLRPFLPQKKDTYSLLVTTRDSGTLPSGSLKVDVDAMRVDEAVQLLRYGLPEGSTEDLQALAARLGEYPLLLKLANGVLRERVEQGGQSLAEALGYIDKALTRKGIRAFDTRDAEERYQAVRLTIEVSLELLKEGERQRYGRLAVFPEDVDVPWATLEKLWGWDDLDTEDFCTALKRLSLLLECDLKHRTIRLHDVIRHYLRDETTIPNLQQQFLDAYRQHLPASSPRNWWQLPKEELYLWRYLAYHLQEAEAEEELADLLGNFYWLQGKLIATDIDALISDYDYLPQSPPPNLQSTIQTLKSTIQPALTLSAHVLKIDSNQLASQLSGRLRSFTEPVIQSLLKQIDIADFLGFHCLSPSLTPPGGALIRTLTGHSLGITTVTVTPDGRRVISGSGDNTLKVWNLETGEELFTLTGHSDPVMAVTVTPDGQRVISGSYDKTLKVWNLETGEELFTLTGHSWWVNAVAVTPDNERVISGSWDKTLKVWNLKTGEEQFTFTRHSKPVTAIAVTPDGRRVISGSDDNTLKVWNLETGEELFTLTGHSDLVMAVTVTPDGQRVISGSEDNTLKVWNLETGEEQFTLTGHSFSVNAVTVTPDGQRVISGSTDCTFKVWNLETGEELFTLTEHSDSVTAVTVTPDSWRVISGSLDRTLKVWNLKTGEEQFTFTRHSKPVTAIAVTPDGRRVISGSDDNTLKVWNLETGEEQFTLTGHSFSVNAVTVTPDGQRVISGSDDNTLKVWNLETGEEQLTFTGYSSWRNAVAITTDSRRVISGSDDNILKVWNLETGEELFTLTGHSDRVTAVAVTPDGWRVISGSWDNTLKVWNLETGEEQFTLTGHSSWVNAVAVTPDGRRVISGSRDNTLKVWNLETGEELFTLTGHSSEVTAVAVTPDSQRVISGSTDCTVKVWNLETGEELFTLTGHSDLVTAAAVTPDGQRVIFGSEDNTLKVWNLEIGKVIATFTGESPIYCCAVAPDGVTVVAGEASGRVHFLELRTPVVG